MPQPRQAGGRGKGLGWKGSWNSVVLVTTLLHTPTGSLSSGRRSYGGDNTSPHSTCPPGSRGWSKGWGWLPGKLKPCMEFVKNGKTPKWHFQPTMDYESLPAAMNCVTQPLKGACAWTHARTAADACTPSTPSALCAHWLYLAGESSAHEEADDDGSRRQVPWKGSEGILSAVKAMACLFLHDLLGHLHSIF